MAEQKFDVFLCHNSEDKPAVIEIAKKLRLKGLKPWLDVWELQPGVVWQFALEQQIESISAVAIFAGQRGMGHWQSEEIYAFLQEFIRRKCPVIPVILPGTKTQPRLPIFLRNRHWVDFRLQNPDPFSQLIWGITGERSGKESLNIAERIILQENKRFPYVAKPVLENKCADLEHYLKSGQWKKADRETYRLMITEVGKAESQWFSAEDLLNFPCELLKAIDEIWVKHSGGKFGFSVQKAIYLECGGSLNGKYHETIWIKLCKRYGWNTNNIQYKLKSRKGHLPVPGPEETVGLFRLFGSGYFHTLSSLASRLASCNL